MATYIKVQDLCDRLTRLSGQVPGSSVQVYAQDIWIDMINAAVRTIARRNWWPHLMQTFYTATDGTTGVLTADLSKIVDFIDIRAIYRGSDQRPLPYFSDLVNPLNYTGSSAVGFIAIPYGDAQYSNKLIRIMPATAQEQIVLRARIIPQKLQLTDVLPFDQDLILYAVLWAYFEDEGDNPTQMQKYLALYNDKYTEQIGAFGNHGISTDSNYPMSSDGWQMT